MTKAERACRDCGAPITASSALGRCVRCAAPRVARQRETVKHRVAARWSERQRRAQAEAISRAHADGRLSPPPRGIGREWTEEEDGALRRLAGRVPLDDLVAAVNAFSPFTRTRVAVQLRLCRRYLDLGQAVALPGADAIRRGFGATPEAVHRWLARGLLRGRRVGPGRHSPWCFEEAEVLRFIREHVELYDRRRIRVPRWRAEAELAWKADPLLTPDEAAAYLGVDRERLRELVHSGALVWIRARGRTWYRRSELIRYATRRAA